MKSLKLFVKIKSNEINLTLNHSLDKDFEKIYLFTKLLSTIADIIMITEEETKEKKEEIKEEIKEVTINDDFHLIE